MQSFIIHQRTPKSYKYSLVLAVFTCKLNKNLHGHVDDRGGSLTFELSLPTCCGTTKRATSTCIAVHSLVECITNHVHIDNTINFLNVPHQKGWRRCSGFGRKSERRSRWSGSNDSIECRDICSGCISSKASSNYGRCTTTTAATPFGEER